MNKIVDFSSVIILGKRGRLSNSLVKQFDKFEGHKEVLVVSSRELLSQKFNSIIESKKNAPAHTIFWCSGSASNRSSLADCQSDESTLKLFIEIYTKKIQTPPNFIYFSSGGTVYGNSPGVVNEFSPLNPQTHYAEMKVNSEKFLTQSAVEGKINLFIFRLANLYGGMGLTRRKSLIEVALTKDIIHILVNPKSTKQYGTYDDNAQIVLQFMKQFQTKPGFPLIKNIFSEYCYSVEDILRLTEIYNPFLELRKVYPPADSSFFENVILTSVDNTIKSSFRWTSLESYLESRMKR